MSGNGLGLAIVRAILDKHNGRYQIYIKNKKFVFDMLI
ncbi:GHKL domain-containing protein [Tepidibacter hydrothermalis]